MITERKVFGKIEILPDGEIQLREDTIIERDGVEISRLYHRRVIEPDITHNEVDGRLIRIIGIVWTPEVIEEYKKKKVERGRGLLR